MDKLNLHSLSSEELISINGGSIALIIAIGIVGLIVISDLIDSVFALSLL